MHRQAEKRTPACWLTLPVTAGDDIQCFERDALTGGTILNPFDLVQRHHRTRLICHAIRHLLDHTPEDVTSCDVEAIDILQSAINPVEDAVAGGQIPPRCAPPSNAAAAAQLEDVLEYVT